MSSAAALHRLDLLRAQLGSAVESKLAVSSEEIPVLGLSWPGLDLVLPDGGLPRGVVELSSPFALGGSTSLALAAVTAGQERSADAWCAWIDPESSLHAPGVVAAGVELSRMLVVRPARSQLGRVAVKLVGSGAFEVVVVDLHPMGHAGTPPRAAGVGGKRQWSPEVLVRKLALAAEPSAATVILLTDSTQARTVPWPAALRLDLFRPSQRELSVRVAKDRRGRTGLAKTLTFRPVARAAI